MLKEISLNNKPEPWSVNQMKQELKYIQLLFFLINFVQNNS